MCSDVKDEQPRISRSATYIHSGQRDPVGFECPHCRKTAAGTMEGAAVLVSARIVLHARFGPRYREKHGAEREIQRILPSLRNFLLSIGVI
jgi:hypothetical protein